MVWSTAPAEASLLPIVARTEFGTSVKRQLSTNYITHRGEGSAARDSRLSHEEGPQGFKHLTFVATGAAAAVVVMVVHREVKLLNCRTPKVTTRLLPWL
jgi:hypothetical protein